MVSHSIVDHAYVCWKIRRASGPVWIKEKQGMIHALQPPPGHGPVYDFVVDIGGCHIVDVLGIVFATDCLSHADELIRLHVLHTF